MYGAPLYDFALLVYWWSWHPAWAGIPIEDEVGRHLKAGGASGEEEAERLRICLLHIGLSTSHIRRPLAARATWSATPIRLPRTFRETPPQRGPGATSPCRSGRRA